MIRPFILMATIVAFIAGSAPLNALETTSGKIKLVLHDDMGRFSIYYLSNPEKKKYTSFFVDQDTRTSFLSLLIDNKVFRMGENSNFKETREKLEDGAKLTWVSDQVEASETFKFISTSNSDSDGIKIVLSMKNITDKAIKVGVRYLFDTYLGERTGVHFRTNRANKTENEAQFDKSNMIEYWISSLEPENEPVKMSVKMTCIGSGVTTPDKIVFANWKRLNDVNWSYTALGSRNFSVRPYSINDSAVSVYYNAQPVAPGASRDITIMLAYFGLGSPTPDETQSQTTEDKVQELQKEVFDVLKNDQKPASTPGAKGSDAENNKVVNDLTTVENLINEINRILLSGADISEKDIQLMEQMLSELNQRLKKY